MHIIKMYKQNIIGMLKATIGNIDVLILQYQELG